MLKVQNLSYKINQKTILDNINFKLQSSSVTTVMGPNGAGKSTLLKICSGHIKEFTGEVFLKEASIHNLAQKDIAKTISHVPQDYFIPFDFTVKEIILMGRYPYIKKIKGLGEKDFSIADRIIHDLNLTELADRYATTLSGGESARCILGKALASQSEILTLDEVTAPLDLRHNLEIMQMIRELAMSGKSIFMAIHDIRLAWKYADNVLLLKEGNIIDYGKTRDVINKSNIMKAFDINVISRSEIKEDFPWEFEAM